jgi:uncharacterized SAM-binding protein YcdF (DUF218 family)
MKARAWIALSVVLALVVGILLAAHVLVQWRAIPRENTARTRFDVILVLGVPCRKDGSPSLIQKVRVSEGVREWRRGVAPRLILSGGPAHNRWVEADCMARIAEAQGVPASAIFEERQALDTIQNVYYAHAIMQGHGWTSADVVSNWGHLPRAALILHHYPIEWRTQIAPMAWYLEALGAVRDWEEALYCMRLERFGFKPSRFISRW